MRLHGCIPAQIRACSFFTLTFREKHICFAGPSQQDAQEMLRFLLTHLQEAAHSSTSCSVRSPAQQGSPYLPLSDDGGSSSSSTLRKDGIQSDSQTQHTGTSPAAQSSGQCRSLGIKNQHSSGQLRRGTKLFKDSAGCAREQSTSNGQSRKLTDFYPIAAPVAAVSQSAKPHSYPPAASDGGETNKLLTATQPSLRADFVSSIFQGSLVYQTRCFECDSSSSHSETFFDISVPVLNPGLSGFTPSHIKEGIPMQLQDANSQVGPYSLSWAISLFASRERLNSDNKYRCSECGCFTEAERRILFSKLPRVMTIHLNRFATQTRGLDSAVTVRKVTGNISIPLTLCFEHWATAKCPRADRMYHLFAVIFHSGSTCTSGHYTACIRADECAPKAGSCEQDKASTTAGQWFFFDDEVVEKMRQEQLLNLISPLTVGSNTPYILFYTS